MIKVYFINGFDSLIEKHYNTKDYRDDVFVEINGLFFEVYFYTQHSLTYEMRLDGFFSIPGIIILDDISNKKIINSIRTLHFEYDFFNSFKGVKEFSNSKSFQQKYLSNKLSDNYENLIIIEISPTSPGLP